MTAAEDLWILSPSLHF